MADPSPSYSIPFNRNIIQLNRKTISASGNSIVIRKGVNGKIVREKQIFTKSKIQFLILIGEKNEEKAFFLALSSKHIALFQLKKESPISIFKLDEKIVDYGTVEVLDMGRRKEGENNVKLIIPIAFYSGSMRKIRLIVHFSDSQITKQKMKFLEEITKVDEKMKFCADLGSDKFFGFFEDTVVKSDGLVTRAGEPSSKKKRRIAIVARELWNGNILLATENGSIRVIRVKDDGNKSSDSLAIISEGQCIPPYCTLRCREPSFIISTENTVIIGTKRGEIHFLDERLELRCKLDTEGGPVNCLKLDENGTDFLWVGFESGELRMLFMPDSEQNDKNYHEEEIRSEDEVAPQPKKRIRSDAGRKSKKSETEMECLELGCYYTTHAVDGFIQHLRHKHRATLPLAGLVFRCQCGNESVSIHHSRMCNIANFTVVRKQYFGPTRTFADKKMTPQCTECELYPRTICGYTKHLKEIHRKSLVKIGCFLKCGVCGDEVTNHSMGRAHPRKCKSRFFSLLKLDESEKKDETEMDQTADA